jgi:ribose 1,5-bisphosphokinase PhnN
MNGAIIYLFGYSGCGKLTIAKAIQARMDCIVVHNHLINNVIFSLIDPDGKTKLPPAVWTNVRRVRSAAFDTIRDLAKPGRIFILTNCLLDDDPEDADWFQEVVQLAGDRHAYFLPVRLTISPEELARRVVSPGRAEQFKEIDPVNAMQKANRSHVFRPKGHDTLELNITAMSADIAAEQIVTRFRDTFAHNKQGIPEAGSRIQRS